MSSKTNAALVPIAALTLALAVVLCSARALAQDEGEKPYSPPTLEKIADNVWVHKSYAFMGRWGLVLSHGMVVKTEGGVILVDTAWNDKDTHHLLGLIEEATGAAPKAAIITHAHDDKMGGMGALNERGVPTVMHHWTMLDGPARGLAASTVPQSRIVFENKENADADGPVRLVLGADGEEPALRLSPVDGATGENAARKNNAGDGVVIYYPGPGHTRDNIVVYYDTAKTLFGGCLIRHAITRSLGNTADGYVDRWARTTRKAAAAFPDAEIVIPSHGPAAGPELLGHTVSIAQRTTASRD